MCEETLKSLLLLTNLVCEHVSLERDNPSTKHQFRIPHFFVHVQQTPKSTPCNASPIGSMGLVYVATICSFFHGKLVGKYTVRPMDPMGSNLGRQN